MAKTKALSDRATAPPDYRAWKTHATALLERQSIWTGIMRERDWRQCFIRGETPEETAEWARVLYHNSRPFNERMRPKR
jgi:hypothetical protein